ncbi:MAG TPA: hypothetical protein VF397_15395 [Pyrinomonadaceae bacterium]
MNWNWDPRTWKTSTKLLLGLSTLWPIIYIGLFMVLIFSGVLFGAILSERAGPGRTNLDLIQLEKKIQNGEINELRITANEIVAIDRNGRSFETSVSNESTRAEIIRQAQQLDSNNHPRVSKIEENSSEGPASPIFPIGIGLFFLCHMLTILLMFVLMPLYIILAVKDERHDQTTRIIWVVLLATMGMFANPVYWYLYIWRKVSPLAEPPSNPI